MSNMREIIRRAKALAELGENAPQRPWFMYYEQDALAYPQDIIISYRAHTGMSVITNGTYNNYLASLFQAIPDMIELLKEMAELLEKMEEVK